MFLQRVGEELVHLGDLGGDGEVDGAVADLDDETAEDLGVDGVGDLELLALADEVGHVEVVDARFELRLFFFWRGGLLARELMSRPVFVLALFAAVINCFARAAAFHGFVFLLAHFALHG